MCAMFYLLKIPVFDEIDACSCSLLVYFVCSQLDGCHYLMCSYDLKEVNFCR